MQDCFRPKAKSRKKRLLRGAFGLVECQCYAINSIYVLKNFTPHGRTETYIG